MGEPGESSGVERKKGITAVLGRPVPTGCQLLLGGGHLAALWALAFVQPLLDLLGDNPEFFVARGNSTGDILILAIGFTLLPPLVMLAVEWVVVRVSPKAYHLLHFLLMAGIAGFLFIQLFPNQVAVRSAVILLLAFGLGCLLAWMTIRFVFVKNLMDILIISPVVIWPCSFSPARPPT